MSGSRARLFVLWLPLLAMSAVACTTTKGPDEPRATPAQTSTVGITTVPPPAPTSLQENALQTSDEGPAPQPVGLAMGAACKRDDAIHCGTKDRISVELKMHNLPPRKKQDLPCEMVILPHAEYADVAMGCVKDERVYLAGECPMCRMSSRWELTGLVAEMTDAQLVQAQKRLTLAAEPLLRTPEAWRSAIATAATRPPPARKR